MGGVTWEASPQPSSLLFLFSSFPLFISEALLGDHVDQNPFRSEVCSNMSWEPHDANPRISPVRSCPCHTIIQPHRYGQYAAPAITTSNRTPTRERKRSRARVHRVYTDLDPRMVQSHRHPYNINTNSIKTPPVQMAKRVYLASRHVSMIVT